MSTSYKTNNKFDNLTLFEAFRGSAKSTVLKYILIYLLIKKLTSL